MSLKAPIRTIASLERERTEHRIKTSQTSITPDEIIKVFVRVLNEATSADNNAISELIEKRVGCNENIAYHPYITVSQDCKLGLLGMINGVCTALTGRVVCAEYNDSGILTGFKEQVSDGNLMRPIENNKEKNEQY